MKKLLQRLLSWTIDSKGNPYHPLVWISGTPRIGENTYIGGFSEIYAKGSKVQIGKFCDIASFVVINCADSSRKTTQFSTEIEKLPIVIGNHVFIGTQSAILGGTIIGHHSVIGAGVVLKKANIPAYSMVKRDESGKIIISPIMKPIKL